MKRRLEIARGFLHTPKILFLDEPTLGLDPQSRNQLWTHVKSLNETEQATVFLTTHYMDEAERVAHRIAIIDHGAIVAQGTAAELKAQTQTESLEAAFLSLTGSAIRDEQASAADQMRQFAQAWRKPAMSAIYILWLREMKRYFRSRAQIIGALGQPMLYLLALGFGLGPVFQKAGPGQLHPVPGARRHRHDGAVLGDVLRHRAAVGPPVRLPQGNARCAGAALARDDRAHARRRHRCDVARPAGADRVHHRRLSAREFRAGPARAAGDGAHRDCVLWVRHGAR